ncbi:MAG: DegT/DnrJ/EryC1/StrS family aminotransferase [Nitrospiraceae bacterium]
MRDTYLVFGSPQIESAEIEEVIATLRSGWIGTGPKAGLFEQRFQDYVKAPHAVALNSCTAALHLSMVVAGVGSEDEIITSSLTFAATGNAILHAGARPVFVDVDPTTGNIDPRLVAQAVTRRTRALLPVHYAGRPCDLDPLREMARRHHLVLIEDASHCIEGWYKGRKIGSIGDLTCFSFYASKNLTTAEGGMVTTNNPEYAGKVRSYSLHGLSTDAWKRFSDGGYKHYEVMFPGYKYNMTDIQASLGLHQLGRLSANLARRESIWAQYDKAFAELPIQIPAPAEQDTVHARHLYTILIDEEKTGLSRDAFMHALHQRKVGTGVHYVPLHLHSYYRQRFGFRVGDFPHAERIGRCTVSLPLSPKLTQEDIHDVIEAVGDALGSE